MPTERGAMRGAWLAAALLALAPAVRAQPAKIELYGIPTLTVSAPAFLNGDRSGRAALIAGELRLPQAQSGRLPAVLLMPGADGVRANVERWADEFVGMGFAAFIVDSHSGRSAQESAPLHELALMFDAFRALERLAAHPRIDPERIAIVGFADGAVAAVYSAVRRFQRLYGPVDANFAAHVGVHTQCNVSYLGETETGARPIRLFHGADDDLAQAAACREYVRRLARADRDAKLVEYPGAGHLFDVPGPASAERNGPNAAACRLEERAGGRIVNLENGRPPAPQDRCVTGVGHVGYDAQAQAQVIDAVKAFLATALKRD